MSKTLIFADYGMEIFEDNKRYWMRYDAGEIASNFVEIEISEEEMQHSKQSERAAYLVAVAHQNQRRKMQP